MTDTDSQKSEETRGDAEEGSRRRDRSVSEDGRRDTEAAGPLADDESSKPDEPGQENQVEDQDQTSEQSKDESDEAQKDLEADDDNPDAKWFVVHTYSGHENRVATTLKQRVESEHLEDKILDVFVPTQDKIEIRGGKKETVKEKIFPGYILVKMILDDNSWLVVRTTQGVTSFVGIGNKPTPIPSAEVKTIMRFMTQGAQPTYKQVFSEGDTVKIIDGPFAEFIGKVDNVDKERGKVKVLVSIFGRETPVELDFLQVQKL
ncbi:transcription termination/antitermination factor NusG [Candidatus Daviesbacteria bacterium]|nr:transcription termination/antitermination factor NusG [Candidatus Daviesbacteria bacterium]